jgi:hypothetical protein
MGPILAYLPEIKRREGQFMSQYVRRLSRMIVPKSSWARMASSLRPPWFLRCLMRPMVMRGAFGARPLACLPNTCFIIFGFLKNLL